MIKFKDLENKQCFMFVNDSTHHYTKSGYNSYFCHENNSHCWTSGEDLTKLENRDVCKVRVIYELEQEER